MQGGIKKNFYFLQKKLEGVCTEWILSFRSAKIEEEEEAKEEDGWCGFKLVDAKSFNEGSIQCVTCHYNKPHG